MSKCDTCKNSDNCKESEAHGRFEELVAVGEEVNCTGYEYKKLFTREEIRELLETIEAMSGEDVHGNLVIRYADFVELKDKYGERRENGKS